MMNFVGKRILFLLFLVITSRIYCSRVGFKLVNKGESLADEIKQPVVFSKLNDKISSLVAFIGNTLYCYTINEKGKTILVSSYQIYSDVEYSPQALILEGYIAHYVKRSEDCNEDSASYLETVNFEGGSSILVESIRIEGSESLCGYSYVLEYDQNLLVAIGNNDIFIFEILTSICKQTDDINCIDDNNFLSVVIHDETMVVLENDYYNSQTIAKLFKINNFTSQALPDPVVGIFSSDFNNVEKLGGFSCVRNYGTVTWASSYEYNILTSDLSLQYDSVSVSGDSFTNYKNTNLRFSRLNEVTKNNDQDLLFQFHNFLRVKNSGLYNEKDKNIMTIDGYYFSHSNPSFKLDKPSFTLHDIDLNKLGLSETNFFSFYPIKVSDGKYIIYSQTCDSDTGNCDMIATFTITNEISITLILVLIFAPLLCCCCCVYLCCCFCISCCFTCVCGNICFSSCQNRFVVSKSINRESYSEIDRVGKRPDSDGPTVRAGIFFTEN